MAVWEIKSEKNRHTAHGGGGGYPAGEEEGNYIEEEVLEKQKGE